MTNTMLSESSTNLVVNYLYYLLLTSHICLFVDLSRLQKYPASRLNHLLASMISSLVAVLFTNTISFSSAIVEVTAGIAIALSFSAAIILVIQRVVKIGNSV